MDVAPVRGPDHMQIRRHRCNGDHSDRFFFFVFLSRFFPFPFFPPLSPPPPRSRPDLDRPGRHGATEKTRGGKTAPLTAPLNKGDAADRSLSSGRCRSIE